MSEFDLIPELGDRITIESALYGETFGTIIYRSEALIRIRPYNASDRGINFPLDPETQEFTEALGVSRIKIHRKATEPHFSKQLSVFPGDQLEFLTSEGLPIQGFPTAIVAQVIATEDQDAILLENGAVVDFQFLGPPEPIEVIVPKASEEDVATPENNTKEAILEEVEEEIDEIPEWELPPAIVEEIPTSERTYPDSVQREEMFISLLMDIPQHKQKNPKILRNLYRKTDVLLSLKNSIVVRDDSGSIQVGQEVSYTPTTVKDCVNDLPISSLLPVAAVKKVIYTDNTDEPGEFSDVEVRPDVVSLFESTQADAVFKPGVENPFLSYIDLLLRKNLPTFVPLPNTDPTLKTTVDQDVLRTKLPNEVLQGFPTRLGMELFDNEAVTSEFIGTVQDRTARVIAGTYYRNDTTGQRFQTSPPDTAATVAHILLSTDLLLFRSPIHSSVLLWDVEASEKSRANAGSFYRLLQNSWGNQQILTSDSDTLLADEIAARLEGYLPTAIVSRSILGITDSLGLQTREFSDSVMVPIQKALEAGQKAWVSAMTELQSRAKQSHQNGATHPTRPLVRTEDPLWTSQILQDTEIAREWKTLQEIEPSLKDVTSVRTNFFSKEANGTLGSYWYALASQKAAIQEYTKKVYLAERLRLERRLANRRTEAAALSASPVLNSCSHVHELESLRGVKEDGKRMLLFKKFVDKYKGGLDGNWVTCASCKQGLVCRHELMLLNEYLHPGRGQNLHKSLLLEFSGPVFEGAYICKNCGQKISDLEYDTGLEYGDDGQPLVGRTIIDPTAEDVEELDLTVAMAEEGKESDTMGFKDSDLPLFYLARAILENAGIMAGEDIYKRLVMFCKLFLAKVVPDKEKYEKKRLEMQAAAQGKKGAMIPLAFDIYDANFRVGGMAALVIIELQTSNPSIPFPARGCKLDKSGFPLEPSGNGAIRYIACVIAGMIRKDYPWVSVAWTRETNIAKRIDLAEKAIMNSMAYILALSPMEGRPPYPAIANLTEECQNRLAEVRAKQGESAAADELGIGLASSADKLPLQFRPIPNKIPQSELETESIQNSEQFLKNSEQGDLEKVGAFIKDRQLHLIFSVMNTFHQAAKENTVVIQPQRSDAICCFQDLGTIRQAGYGINALSDKLGESQKREVEMLETAAKTLQNRNPASSSNGTHFYVPWSAPPVDVLEPQSDPSMYYLLFLKHCFRGENMGRVHEFQDNYECRFCLFRIPEELDFMVAGNIGETDGKRFEAAMKEMNTQRKAIVLQAFADQSVNINESSFQALEDAIHVMKTVQQVPLPRLEGIETLMSEMTQLLEAAPFVESVSIDWTEFMKGFQQILRSPGDDELKRKLRLSSFSGLAEDRKAAIQLRLLDLFGARPTASQKVLVEECISAISEISESIKGNQAAKNLKLMFGVHGEQIANQYVEKLPVSATRKWFPTISRSHKELLAKIWENQSQIVQTAVKSLNELNSEIVQETIHVALSKMSQWIGVWTHFWIEKVRPIFLTEEELQMILEWSIVHVIAAFLTDSSPLFITTSDADKKKAILFFHSWILDTLKTTKHQVNRFQMSAHKIQEAIQARTELEHSYFVKRFDDLDRDLRKLELLKKKYKIGDWNVGTTKNLFSYNADFFEFERAQRAAMGLPDFGDHITGGQAKTQKQDYGFYQFGTETVKLTNDNDHRVAADED